MNTSTRETLISGGSINVPTLAAALGISRNGAYEAVKRGEIAVTRLGRRIVVPAREARRLLGMETSHAA